MRLHKLGLRLFFERRNAGEGKRKKKSSREPVHWTEKALLILLLSFRNNRHRLSRTYALETINPVCNMQLLLCMLLLNWNAACLFLTVFLTGSFFLICISPSPQSCFEQSQKDPVIRKHLRLGLKSSKRHFSWRMFCSFAFLAECRPTLGRTISFWVLLLLLRWIPFSLISPKTGLQSIGWRGQQAWWHEMSL